MKTINYKNIEWIVLEETEEYTKLLAKEGLSKKIIEDICETEKFYEGYMAHMNNLKYPYSWEKSNIRKVLNGKFLDKYLDRDDLFEDGENSRVRLLTKEEVEDLDYEIRKCNNWYWTMSQYSDSSSDVWRVSGDGNLGSNDVYGNFGVVRPVIYLKSNLSSDREDNREQIEPFTTEYTCRKLDNEIIDYMNMLKDEINKLKENK